MGRIDLLARMFTMARGRDGQARALDPAQGQASPLGGTTAAALTPSSPAAMILDATATKVLDGWLANRRQTLAPHTLNFRTLTSEQAELLIGIMAAAAQADGQIDASEVRQLPSALLRAGAEPTDLAKLDAALATPQPLPQLLTAAQQADISAHAFAVALLAINRGQRVNQAFLDYLALRLGLSREVARSLKRRYRA